MPAILLAWWYDFVAWGKRLLLLTPLIQLAMLGLGPLVFVPLSSTFGRRPVWILTILCAMLLNIGVSFIQSYGGHIALRILIPFFLSPPIALGGAVVAETFFAPQRATKLVRRTSCILVISHAAADGYIQGYWT